jgi:hypothetical protein
MKRRVCNDGLDREFGKRSALFKYKDFVNRAKFPKKNGHKPIIRNNVVHCDHEPLLGF